MTAEILLLIFMKRTSQTHSKPSASVRISVEMHMTNVEPLVFFLLYIAEKDRLPCRLSFISVSASFF